MALGEFAGQHAQRLEFPVEEGQQESDATYASCSRTVTFLVRRSTTVSKAIGSGAGSACSSASMRSRSVPLTLSFASSRVTLETDDARLEAADAGLDEHAQLLAAARIVEGAGGEVGQSKPGQRAIELGEMRIPGPPLAGAC